MKTKYKSVLTEDFIEYDPKGMIIQSDEDPFILDPRLARQVGLHASVLLQHLYELEQRDDQQTVTDEEGNVWYLKTIEDLKRGIIISEEEISAGLHKLTYDHGLLFRKSASFGKLAQRKRSRSGGPLCFRLNHEALRKLRQEIAAAEAVDVARASV